MKKNQPFIVEELRSREAKVAECPTVSQGTFGRLTLFGWKQFRWTEQTKLMALKPDEGFSGKWANQGKPEEVLG